MARLCQNIFHGVKVLLAFYASPRKLLRLVDKCVFEAAVPNARIEISAIK